MSQNKLRIIGGAQRVWLRTRDTITDVMRETEIVGHQLAGAAVLQAKYQHRESADIDVILTGSDETAHEAMKLIAERSDATIKPVGENTYQLQLANMPEENHLDIFIRTEQGHPTDRLDIEGREEPASTTAEVLYEKLIYRGHKAVTRDVFDIAIAEIHEPLEVERAINAVPPRTWAKTILEIWRSRDDYRESVRELQLHSNDAMRVAEDLATIGSRTVRSARYSCFDVDIRDHAATLYTKSALRGENWIEWDTPELTTQKLQAGWYDKAMTVRGLSIEDVITQVNSALKDGTPDRIIVPCNDGQTEPAPDPAAWP